MIGWGFSNVVGCMGLHSPCNWPWGVIGWSLPPVLPGCGDVGVSACCVPHFAAFDAVSRLSFCAAGMVLSTLPTSIDKGQKVVGSFTKFGKQYFLTN